MESPRSHVYDVSGRRRWFESPGGNRLDEEMFDAATHQWIPLVKLPWYERIPAWLELTMVAGASAGALLLRELVVDWL